MKHSAFRFVYVFVFFSAVMWSVEGFAKKRDHFFLADIRGKSDEFVDLIKGHKEIQWWIQNNDEMLVKASEHIAIVMRQHIRFKQVVVPPHRRHLFLATGLPHRLLEDLGFQVLIYGGRTGVIATESDAPLKVQTFNLRVRGFEPNQFLTETRSWQQPEKKKPRHPLIEGILKEIKPERWLEDVTTLSQTNRFTKKVEGTEKTIQWLKNEFGKAGIAHVREQGFKLGSYSSSNVIATIPGKSRSDIYVLGAHFDSTSENPWNKAPGAEDNGSGTAALVEIARVLSKYPSPAEIQIVAFGAEEQGLYGSRHYVRRLFETGSAASVKGVLILDMIGFTNDHHYDVLLETSSEQEKMTDDIFTTGQLYSGLDLHRTFHYWGSDHVPFLERNMPAVLIIENDYQFYPHYHRSTDTADTISGLQGHEVLKLVTAQLLTWAHQNEATY